MSSAPNGEGGQGESTLLTIREAAERLRVAPSTVYRWCRAGRIRAKKFGRAWRIPAGQLQPDEHSARPMALPALLGRFVGQVDHVLALVPDKSNLHRLEAAFFEATAAAGGRIVAARWLEEEADVERRLRPAVAAAGPRAQLRILEVATAYEREGGPGPRKLVLKEIREAERQGLPCYFYGSPLHYFGYHQERLVDYERYLDCELAGESLLTVCGYALDELSAGGRAITTLIALMDCHSKIIFYDGDQALLRHCAPAS
jgi:excisionase family DNA binding protein